MIRLFVAVSAVAIAACSPSDGPSAPSLDADPTPTAPGTSAGPGPTDQGGADGGADGAGACATSVVRAGAEVILLADRSGSMEEPEPPTAPSSKFALMTKSLNGLLTAMPSRDVVAGLVWLPQPPPVSTAAQCLPASYETFAVAPGVVGDGAGAAISSALGAGAPGGSSAWSAALRGATKLALQEANAHPERAVSLLMIADEVPTGCGVTEATPFVIPPEIAAATATGQLRVFMIGLSAGGAQVKALDDQIATAGGTTAAYLPNLRDAGTLDLALATVRERASCVVNLPSAFDKGDIWLSSGDRTKLAKVADAAACSPTGWYLVGARAQLCPDVCKRAVSSPGSTLTIEPQVCP